MPVRESTLTAFLSVSFKTETTPSLYANEEKTLFYSGSTSVPAPVIVIDRYIHNIVSFVKRSSKREELKDST